MDMTLLRSLFTVLMFITFIGIVIWAWSSKRKQAFDEAANLPFADDEQADASGRRKDKK